MCTAQEVAIPDTFPGRGFDPPSSSPGTQLEIPIQASHPAHRQRPVGAAVVEERLAFAGLHLADLAHVGYVVDLAPAFLPFFPTILRG